MLICRRIARLGVFKSSASKCKFNHLNVRPSSSRWSFISQRLLHDTELSGLRINEQIEVIDSVGDGDRQSGEGKTSLLQNALGVGKDYPREHAEHGEAVKRSRARGNAAVDIATRGERASRKIDEVYDEGAESATVKGFLELNPYVCSGCGTGFQSKSDGEPGYLPKDILKEHLQKADKLKAKQRAIKLLEMAGLEVDSDLAESILVEAEVPADIIKGVREIGRRAAQKRIKLKNKGEIFHEDPEEANPQGLGNLLQATSSKAIKLDQNVKYDKDGNKIEFDDSMWIIGEEGTEYPLRDYSRFEKKDPNRHKKKKGGKVAEAAIEGEVKEEYQKYDDDAICICQRCFRLNQYGSVETELRPGWSENELLSPARFEELLGSLRDSDGVVLCIVDVFDLKGSLLANLKQIAGKNPIVIAANKADLLPKDASPTRIINWIHTEVKDFCDLRSPKEADEALRRYTERFAERGIENWSEFRKEKKSAEEGILRRANVHLVSAQSGMGMDQLLKSLHGMAMENGHTVYVMGAANVGKSSFINRLLEGRHQPKKTSPKTKKSSVPQATVSNLPGTTLNFLKIKLPNGITMVDTPGLLKPDQLTAKLTVNELKQVIPSRPINAVTLRVEEGRVILLGGLASIELIEGKPFHFTFFVSNEVKLHSTMNYKMESFLEKHVGTLISPPESPERMEQLGPFESYEFRVTGESWKKSVADIVIAGLGWISITGVGPCHVKVRVPFQTGVQLREPLLPFEARYTTAKFTGGRIFKKSSKPGKQKQYGWRA